MGAYRVRRMSHLDLDKLLLELQVEAELEFEACSFSPHSEGVSSLQALLPRLLSL